MNTSSKEYQMLIHNLKNGAVDIEEAANVAGINVMSLFKALERGKIEENRISERSLKPKKSEEEFLKAWVETRQAIAAASVEIQIAYHQEAKEDWRGALSWLERRNPMHFGKINERIEISGIQGKLDQLEGN